MISNDCPARSSRTSPNPRHHFAPAKEIDHTNQCVMQNIGLVHNHPSGDPSPSRADIEMTKEIIDTGSKLGIVVHDHIIIGKKGHASMKGLLLI